MQREAVRDEEHFIAAAPLPSPSLLFPSLTSAEHCTGREADDVRVLVV